MRLHGSCHCGAVRFSVDCHEPYPFLRCYCSICRKTTGGGGYAINLGGDARTLTVEGGEHVRIYQAMIDAGDGRLEQSPHQRHFCARCGSHLWAQHPSWPELVHPVAGAVDTPLPAPPERVHMMVDSKAPWVAIEGDPADPRFPEYPDCSLAEWHAARGLTDGAGG